MRIQRIGLEHHGQVALGRGDLRDVTAIEFDGSRRHFFKPGDQPQQGGFAAARRPDEDHELAVFHIQVDTLDDLVTVKAFLQIADAQVSHVGFLLVLWAGLFDSAERQAANQLFLTDPAENQNGRTRQGRDR